MKNRIWKQIRRTSIAAVAAGNCTGGKYSAGNRFGICISVRAEPESGAELFLDRQREGNGRAGYPDHGIKGLDNGKKDFGRQ